MKFYSVKIGPTLHLTSDGTSTGTACKLAVEGWERVVNPIAGNSVRANSGKPIRQTILRPAGDVFVVRVETWITKTLWDGLVSLINTANQAGSSFTVAAVGETGNFTRTCKPALQDPYTAARFKTGKIFQPAFRFETA